MKPLILCWWSHGNNQEPGTPTAGASVKTNAQKYLQEKDHKKTQFLNKRRQGPKLKKLKHRLDFMVDMNLLYKSKGV